MWRFLTTRLGIRAEMLRWRQHMGHAGVSLEYVDATTGRKFLPHVIEPAVGINRLGLMVLCDAYLEDAERERTVLRFKPNLAPYQAAVFPS